MRLRPWLSFILLLCLSFHAVSGSRYHPSAIVVGTVSCDTCSKSTHFISGATVAVECGGDGVKSFQEEVKTNEKGEFEAELPFSIAKNMDRVKRCSVKLISSGDPYYAVGATATSSGIRFISKKAGTHVFSAGSFMFKPESCGREDFVGNGFLPPYSAPTPPRSKPSILPLPPLPSIPLPPIPGVPSGPPAPPPPPPPSSPGLPLPIPLPPLPDPIPDPIPGITVPSGN